jgi:hypothetical protein
MKYCIGFVVGIVVAQTGFQGIAKVMDHAVTAVQQQVKELGK